MNEESVRFRVTRPSKIIGQLIGFWRPRKEIEDAIAAPVKKRKSHILQNAGLKVLEITWEVDRKKSFALD